MDIPPFLVMIDGWESELGRSTTSVSNWLARIYYGRPNGFTMHIRPQKVIVSFISAVKLLI
jgi:hypothetical protein